jgi:two-component system, NarL family, nitrate/nitrite response regulator NarL
MKKNKIRLALLDDHQIVIDGLKLLLNDQQNLEVALECINSNQFLQLLPNQEIDIVLTDLIMPNQINGIEICKAIKEKHATISVLVLSMNEDAKVIHQLITEIGVDGFISKAAGKQELIHAINTIYEGNSYFSAEIKNGHQMQLKIIKENNVLHITKREMEIVFGIEKRCSNKQIAEKLFISERTVETHRKNIYRKTNTKGEGALINFLKNKGIL